ncbi:hypothetical protein Y032_0061g3234 [Ancylostoma ceylanicum]|uniref:Uncharacterized protein n=1 Tax=Ancylostoma ceylanicum TaxID=53326 RepID=A0A016U2P1_9BILA|nr:hypothetical protein Y032_0061g3234 [Ancylostoma ceylanicum]
MATAPRTPFPPKGSPPIFFMDCMLPDYIYMLFSYPLILAARLGYNVGKRVLACPIGKVNGHTRQLGPANCYRPGKRVQRLF